MDGLPAVVVNSTEADDGFLQAFPHTDAQWEGTAFFMGCQQKSEHLITVPGPCGGWSIPFSPSQLKWLEEELRQQRGDEWTWGNCPNQVEWFPNGRARDTGEQAGGWMDRFADTTTGAPSHCCGHLLRVVGGDQCSPAGHVTGKWVGWL